jgi:protease I
MCLAASWCLLLAAPVHANPMDRAVAPLSAPAVEAADDAHGDLLRFLLEAVDDPTALQGARVAIVATDGADGFELEVPRRYLAERGALVHVVAPRRPLGAVPDALHIVNPSGEEGATTIDRFLDEVAVLDYDAVYLPGHRLATPALESEESLAFLQQSVHAGRPVFAIANAPLLLLQAGLLERRRATGDAQTFLRLAFSNARATDASLVIDGPIYTSRDAFDMPQLMRRLVAELRRRAPR